MAMLFSILYHSIETEKHQFPGLLSWYDLEFSKKFGGRYHNLFINLDRIAAVLGVYCVVLHYHQNFDTVAIQGCIIGTISVLISEYRRKSYWTYLFTHCLWHVMAFGVANYLIGKH